MKQYLTTLILLLTVCTMSQTAQAQTVETVSGDLTGDVAWTADKEYHLNGLVFVDSLATLTIQPGTVIKGLEDVNITSGDGASALIVRRGAKIFAEGTVTQPIILTSELDDLTDPGDLDQRDRGLWGGLILLGAATTNQPTTNNQIEGIPANKKALYGGNNDEDDSGILRFVSIRHGGFSISGVAGDEINGLTMGAVGSGTTIEFIEVFANLDDCYEWFGGTVHTKYLAGAFCGDDTFDYDQGFRGKHQFWFSIHDDDEAGRAGEHDGGDAAGDDATPFSIPIISNVTYIGAGENAVVPGGDNNDRTFAIRDNAGGKYYNSVFTDFPGVGTNIEDKGPGSSRERLETGDLVLENNIWWGYGAGNTAAAIFDQGFVVDVLGAASANNQIVDPQLAGISRTADNGLDPRPNVGSPALSGARDLGDDFFTKTDYLGAFGKENWMMGWTALSADGFLGNISAVAVEELDAELPSTIALEQNYPNPFNPSTTIEFKVDQAQRVRLSVFDLLGREVAVLIDGVQAAGTYRTSFDARNMASGLYLYQLQTETGSTLTKTMMLLK